MVTSWGYKILKVIHFKKSVPEILALELRRLSNIQMKISKQLDMNIRTKYCKRIGGRFK